MRGIGSSTLRVTFTVRSCGTSSPSRNRFEYRYVETPVNSLPPFQRDSRLENFNSYPPLELTISPRQTANASLSFYPQRLKSLTGSLPAAPFAIASNRSTTLSQLPTIIRFRSTWVFSSVPQVTLYRAWSNNSQVLQTIRLAIRTDFLT